MDDGSMTAEEYLRRSAEITSQRLSLTREQDQLTARMRRDRLAAGGDPHPLLNVFRDAGGHQNGMVPTVSFDADGRPTKVMQLPSPGNGGCDLVLADVHNMPWRARPTSPHGPANAIVRGPMQSQMDTGAYPKLEEHFARTSPAFEPSVDAVGRFESKRLTKEEENAIRTGKNRPSVC